MTEMISLSFYSCSNYKTSYNCDYSYASLDVYIFSFPFFLHYDRFLIFK